MTYQLGIDLGATVTAAAVYRSGRTESVPPRPSVLLVAPDGSLVVGQDAERGALGAPDRLVRQFTHRIGDDTPLVVGGVAMTADTLAARFVARVVSDVATWAGGAPTRVALTHPPGWGRHRLTALRTALTVEGLGDTLFVSSAQAAALAMADPAPVDRLVAVYDFGGTGLDAAVLHRLPDGGFAPAGRPEELEVGGLDLDELVFEHVRAALGGAWDRLDPIDPAVLAAVATLRRECTLAKESLSADTDVEIPVVLPGIDTRVRLARPEFEELVRPVVEETAATLLRAIAAAGDPPAVVLLTGGSARIPLVTQVVSAQLGRPVTVAEDPQGGMAAGAAIAAGRVNTPSPEPTRVVLRAVPAPNLVTPARPPSPVVAPPSVKKAARLPRTVMAAVAATLTAIAAAGGIALATRAAPSDADADPVGNTTTTSQTPESTTLPPATTEEPPPRTTTRRPQRDEPRETAEPPSTTEPPTTTETTTSTEPPTTTWSPPTDAPNSAPETEEVQP